MDETADGTVDLCMKGDTNNTGGTVRYIEVVDRM